jgi:hypothetical protein
MSGVLILGMENKCAFQHVRTKLEQCQPTSVDKSLERYIISGIHSTTSVIPTFAHECPGKVLTCPAYPENVIPAKRSPCGARDGTPLFFKPVALVVAKAGFQIAHFAALRFAFGMTILGGGVSLK